MIETFTTELFFPNMSQYETKVTVNDTLLCVFIQIYQSRKRTNIFITSLTILTAVSRRFDILFLQLSVAQDWLLVRHRHP